jgi:tRNA-binding EMAP/Myf-like protein
MDSRVVNILKLVGVDAGSIKPESSQQNAMLKEVVARKAPQLLEGANDGEVAQWLSFAATASGTGDAAVKTVNEWLAMRSYMAGFKLSIADVAVFEALSISAASWDVAKLPHVARWYAHVQTQCAAGSAAAAVALPMQDAPSFPVYKAPVVAAPSPSSSGAGGSDCNKKEGDKAKKDKGAASTAAPAAAAAAAAPVPAAADDAGDPSKIAFVVGKVVKCWNHEESEKLLCEEVRALMIATPCILLCPHTAYLSLCLCRHPHPHCRANLLTSTPLGNNPFPDTQHNTQNAGRPRRREDANDRVRHPRLLQRRSGRGSHGGGSRQPEASQDR